MTRTIIVAGALLLAIAMASGTLGVHAQSEGVSGTWSGTWHQATFAGALTLRLVQNGENVHGTYDSTDGGSRHGNLREVPVTGTLRGDRLTLKAPDGVHKLEGTVAGDTITGMYWGRFATKRFEVRRTGPYRS